MGSSIAGVHSVKKGERSSLGVVGRQLLESFLSVIDELTAQIKTVEELIEQTATSLEEAQVLITIPGVSFYFSQFITSELGEIGRFDIAEQVVSYAGLDPVVRESGDSPTEGSISKLGGRNLHWILVQGVQTAVHLCQDPHFELFYARLNRRKNHQITIITTARKLHVSIYIYFPARKSTIHLGFVAEGRCPATFSLVAASVSECSCSHLPPPIVYFALLPDLVLRFPWPTQYRHLH